MRETWTFSVLELPVRYRNPKPRYDTGRRPRPLDAPDGLDALKRLAGGYTPIRPPVPRRDEPWYDTRYQTPAEEPDDRVGDAYRGGPDPNYAADDYTEIPALQPRMPHERFARPSRPPRARIPEYKDGRMTSGLFETLMRQTREPGPDPDDAPPDEPPGDAGSLDDVAAGPTDKPAPDDLSAAFGRPSPALAGSPTPADPSPWPGPQAPEDPTARANQAFDEEMRQAFSPSMPTADLEQRTQALFDEQMRQAFAPPQPDPFADPFPGHPGLEQQSFDQQMLMNDPFPDPGPPMM